MTRFAPRLVPARAALNSGFMNAVFQKGVLLSVIVLSAAIVWPQLASTAAAQDFHAERAKHLNAVNAAKTGRVQDEALDALARYYWSHGLLPEAAAVIAAMPGAEAHPLYDIIAVVRGLSPPSVLNERVATEPLAAFVSAGRRAEDAPSTPLPAPLLTAAVDGVDTAPEALIARYAPALTHAAASSDHRRPTLAFARAAQHHSGPDAEAFVRGRIAEAAGDLSSARQHYQTAAHVGGRWGAEARFRLIGLDWADGVITPADAARNLEVLLVDWPDDALAKRVLLALARANEFAGHPDRAADALALTASRYSVGSNAPTGAVAARRLDELLRAIYVHQRFPEMGLAQRIDVYVRTRPWASAPVGEADYDAAHLDGLLAAGLTAEVLALTDPTKGWATTPESPAFARRLTALRIVVQNAPSHPQLTLPEVAQAQPPRTAAAAAATLSSHAARAQFTAMTAHDASPQALDDALAIPAAYRSSAP